MGQQGQEGKTAAGTRMNLEGTGVVVSMTGNVVTFEDGKRVHPNQVRIRKEKKGKRETSI